MCIQPRQPQRQPSEGQSSLCVDLIRRTLVFNDFMNVWIYANGHTTRTWADAFGKFLDMTCTGKAHHQQHRVFVPMRPVPSFHELHLCSGL